MPFSVEIDEEMCRADRGLNNLSQWSEAMFMDLGDIWSLAKACHSSCGAAEACGEEFGCHKHGEKMNRRNLWLPPFTCKPYISQLSMAATCVACGCERWQTTKQPLELLQPSQRGPMTTTPYITISKPYLRMKGVDVNNIKHKLSYI